MKNITDLVRAVISILTVLLGFVYFFLAAFMYQVHDPQITICIVGLLTMVFGYWIGSSLGSSKKQDTLNEMQKTLADGDPIPSKGPKGTV